MTNTELVTRQKDIVAEFKKDSQIVGDQTVEFLRLVYPSYLVDRNNIESLLDHDSTLQLNGMTYFRISCCTADTVDKVFETVNEKMEKLFTALHSIGVSVGYGLVSRDGITNLVIGVYSSGDVAVVKRITEGMLSGIEMKAYSPDFTDCNNNSMHYGILSGVPSLYVHEQKQVFSLSTIMRSLNGQDYTLLFIAKPLPTEAVIQNISELITVKDKAFAVSKRNVARSSSYSETNTRTDTVNDGKNSIAPAIGQGAGMAAGAGVGAIIGNILVPVIGAGAGAAVGAAVVGGLGTVIGNIIGGGKTHSEGYSDSVAKAITDGETVSADIQNGFALELMNYADKSIERLKGGQSNGIWQTAIAYSAGSAVSRNIIKACLCGELSKPDPDRLPLIVFEPKQSNKALQIPDFLGNDRNNPLCTYINSAELGLLCTVPTESVPDFELRIEKSYPLVRSIADEHAVSIGFVTDGKQVLQNMPFALSHLDLNKHTFICGITGSGKTTTIKKILKEAKKPFLVIEAAKKEYRNLICDTTVYTLGKPEINCPQINPFYIMPGVSPQTHIDYLKDLFNASFSFYGPMPYILEKCLHTVYKNKGWNLTLG